MALRRFKPGDTLKNFSARTFNTIIDAVERQGLGASPAGFLNAPGTVLVTNDTGADVSLGGFVPLSGSQFGVPESGPGGVANESSAKFINADTLVNSSIGKFGITLEPIKDGKTGRAQVYGLVWARIFVERVEHQFADIATLTPNQRLKVTGGSGTFTAGETVTQAGSGATGRFIATGGGYLTLQPLSGTFNTTGALTGGTSGATRNMDTGSGLLQSEQGYLRSGLTGGASIIWKEPGTSSSSGVFEDELKYALLFLGRPIREKVMARITGFQQAGTCRWEYNWTEVEINDDPESADFGRYTDKVGGLSTVDRVYFRAFNRFEARHKTGTSHATGQKTMPVPVDTIVELKPEKTSTGSTRYVFDHETMRVLPGKITAVSGVSGTGPQLASSITYSVQVFDRGATAILTGVRPYWGCPRVESDKIVPALVGDHVLVAATDYDTETGVVWKALIGERFASRGCT